MAPSVACLLLREKLLPWLATLHTTVAPDATVHEDGEAKPITRLMELVEGAMDVWQAHAYNWYLHGTPTGQAAPRVRQLADHDQAMYQEGLAYVEQLAQAYAWCLLPWGVDYTGQMLLFFASDAATFTTILTWLQGGRDHACADLLVSVYPADAFRGQRFRGAIFGRADLRGHGLWHDGRGTSASALVLQSTPEDWSLVLPAYAEVVCQAHVGSSIRRWIRVHDEAALLQQVTGCSPDLVTAGDLDDRWMRESLGHFAQIFAYISGDPLYFGLRALQSASWIYIPETGREHWEIYINNDPAVTSRLLHRAARTPDRWFLHKHFC
jgi:hypothetical protein